VGVIIAILPSSSLSFNVFAFHFCPSLIKSSRVTTHCSRVTWYLKHALFGCTSRSPRMDSLCMMKLTCWIFWVQWRGRTDVWVRAEASLPPPPIPNWQVEPHGLTGLTMPIPK